MFGIDHDDDDGKCGKKYFKGGIMMEWRRNILIPVGTKEKGQSTDTKGVSGYILVLILT